MYRNNVTENLKKILKKRGRPFGSPSILKKTIVNDPSMPSRLVGLQYQSCMSRLGFRCDWVIDDTLPIKQVFLRDGVFELDFVVRPRFELGTHGCSITLLYQTELPHQII